MLSTIHSMTAAIFFFQAEDGIRDDLVTGVQTCALPISLKHRLVTWVRQMGRIRQMRQLNHMLIEPLAIWMLGSRSEERRVGKECRCRWWANPWKHKSGNEPASKRSTVGRPTKRTQAWKM